MKFYCYIIELPAAYKTFKTKKTLRANILIVFKTRYNIELGTLKNLKLKTYLNRQRKIYSSTTNFLHLYFP